MRILSTTLICLASLVNLGPLTVDLVAIPALAVAALIDFSHFRQAGTGL